MNQELIELVITAYNSMYRHQSPTDFSKDVDKLTKLRIGEKVASAWTEYVEGHIESESYNERMRLYYSEDFEAEETVAILQELAGDL